MQKQQQQQESTAAAAAKQPTYNLQHAFITYGDLRANIIEAVDVLDNNHVIPTNINNSNRRNSFNIRSTTMRYCVYAVLEVCQDNNDANNNNNSNNNDDVNDEVKIQVNDNKNNTKVIENINHTNMLMMNRTTTTALNNSIVSTNRIQCNQNNEQPLTIKEEFIFQNVSTVYHFIIKFYVTSWRATNDSTMNTNSVITTTLKSFQKNTYDHHHNDNDNDDDDSQTVCVGFTRIPLYRLQENQKVSIVCE